VRISFPACVGLCLAFAGAGFFIGRAVYVSADVPTVSTPSTQGTSQSSANGPSEDRTRAINPAAEATESREALTKARSRIADLEGSLSASRGEVGELRDELAQFQRKKAVTTAEVMASIETFRKNGLGSLLAPGAKAEIVNDLKVLGEEGLKIIRGLLNSESEEDRILAASLMDGLNDPSTIPDLKRLALEDDVATVAGLAARSLAFMRRPEAAGSLHEIVANSKHRNARINALFGLCSIADPKGIEMALAYMKDPEKPEGIKQALGGGILMLDTPGVLPIVNGISSEVRKHDDAMRAVIAYYRRIGTLEGRNEIQNILNDPQISSTVREMALSALN